MSVGCSVITKIQKKQHLMYFMYVDESGDPGISEYGSKHYILSGLIVSLSNWEIHLDRLKKFRKHIKTKYGLNQRTEIHAAELIRINKNKEYAKLSKSNRIAILKEYCTQIPVIFSEARVINICFDKSKYLGKEDIQVLAWHRLAQRYDTFLKKDGKDKGIIISDDTDGAKVIAKLRQMRVYNPTPSKFGGSYNAPTSNIIEDLFQRSSNDSYFIQTADVIAHCLYRREFPKASLNKYRVHWQFQKIEPILQKDAAKEDPMGIVRR